MLRLSHAYCSTCICLETAFISEQVAYETELSGTPTAVFTEIQLIGQFLVLGIIILKSYLK